MILINILHASSCVGKSTYMMKAHKGFYKIEMDDTQFWTREEKEWPSICFEFLVKHINNNHHPKWEIITYITVYKIYWCIYRSIYVSFCS